MEHCTFIGSLRYGSLFRLAETHNRSPDIVTLCCQTLGLEGSDFCRGYIQHYLKTEEEIPNQSAARIFAAATSILKAGTSATGSL